MWITAATALFALGVAFCLAADAVRQRQEAIERGAARSAALLGAAVALFLAGLQLLLWRADAWLASWPVVAISGLGVVALIGGTAMGWRQQAALTHRQLRRVVIAPAVLLTTGAVMLGAVATAAERPKEPRLSGLTMRLAAAARTDAPMPATAFRLRRHADRLVDQTSRATTLADELAVQYARVDDAKTSAGDRTAQARRSLALWHDRVNNVRADYDDYQQLITPTSDEPLLPADTLPSYVPPPQSYGYPTTRDFGTGNGSIGTCADGTLSDSIGRSGACSHHGGVSP